MTAQHDTPTDDLCEIAATFLRPVRNTLTARMARDLPRDTDWLLGLAERVGIEAHRRSAALAWSMDQARVAITKAAATGQRVITVRAEEYPPLLRQIIDPPLALWARGDVSALSRPSVAVVGARAASPVGLATSRRLGRDLASAGLVVVSGLARGVDGMAHRGALEAKGLTVAVLGCGVDLSYPPEHKELADQVHASGVLVSELPPGTAPLAVHFPLRNRIISGLCRAVVVIEASEKSGSLITARAALEQGRDVLAVPGAVATGRYRGSHALIKDGARLVETVEDVLEEIGWRPTAAFQKPESGKVFEISELESRMRLGEACSLDDLAARTGRQAADLLAELSVLELAGRVTRVPGGSFVRVDSPAIR